MSIQMEIKLPDWLRKNYLYVKEYLGDDSMNPRAFVRLEESERTFDLEQANVISSQWHTDPWNNEDNDIHKVFLDLDCEHWYVPSSTPGHGHLYINVNMRRKDLDWLMGQLYRFGIVSSGWKGQLENRQANTFRLPWIKK
jgi:hypothetical protein